MPGFSPARQLPGAGREWNPGVSSAFGNGGADLGGKENPVGSMAANRPE